MRAFVFLIFGLLLGACAGPTRVIEAPKAPTRVEAAADLASKTVALVGRDREGNPRSYCSGVWVSETSILTAYHCVEEADVGDGVEYAVREDVYAPGELHERASIVTRVAKLYATDEAHDLALLRGF